MTNHSKDSRSIDSGSSSKGESMATETRIEQAREWMKTQPHCIRYHEDGSPSCDGADLVGYDHVPPCPLAGRADLSGRSTLTIPELLAAYALRLSEDTAQSSEARPGVGGAVGSNAADGNSGVEGAREGTTADKSESINCVRCAIGIQQAHEQNIPYEVGNCPDCLGSGHVTPADSREPEKLNTFTCGCKGTDGRCPVHDKPALAESSLSSPPPEFRHSEICLWWHRRPCNRNCLSTFRQSPSPTESGAESAYSGKQNTADKSGLLPTQLPKDK